MTFLGKISLVSFVLVALVGCEVEDDETEQNGNEDVQENSEEGTTDEEEIQEDYESDEIVDELYQFQVDGDYLGTEQPAISLEELSELEGKYLFSDSLVNTEVEEGEFGVPVWYNFLGDTKVEVFYTSPPDVENSRVTGETEYESELYSIETIEEADDTYIVETEEDTLEFTFHGETQLRDSYENVFEIYDTSSEEILEAYNG